MTDTAVATQEKKEVSEIKKEQVADFSLGVFGSSSNFSLATRMAETLARSSIVPKEYQNNACNAMIAIEIAQRLRTSPLMVMQNLNVIQGRPSWSAQFLIAMVNGSGKYDMELQFDEKADKDGKPISCQCWTERKGRKVTGIVVDMDMAKAEGWYGKNGSKWKTMPQVMLRYRAASFFARMNCPELTLGYYSQDEILDGDFKEYSLENMQEHVQAEIAENANSVEFIEDAEIVDEPEKEQEQELPPFMSAE